MTDMIIGLIIGVVGTIITMGLGLIGGIYLSCRLQHKGSIFPKKRREQSSPWKKVKTNAGSSQNNRGTGSKGSKSSISSTTKSINTD